MSKRVIPTIQEKNRVIGNIIDALARRQAFLVLGHQSPDDDCIASMIAFALLAGKFNKPTYIYLGNPIHEHFQYLLNICHYNAIPLLYEGDPMPGPVDTVVLCDTPKPSMIEASGAVRELLGGPKVLRIEIDHHLGTDSAYFGNRGYRLVTEASSASELVGLVLLKLRCRSRLLKRFNIQDLVSRNIVLAVLTGIVGDSRMGTLLKSGRQRRYYHVFSNMFNELLMQKTVGQSNFSDMSQVFQEIQKLSQSEERCFRFFLQRKRFSVRIGYVALGLKDSERLYGQFGRDTLVSTARAIADELAEESGRLGLVCYCDPPEESGLIQFRLRRSQRYKGFDLRPVLERFGIENGGGHEGAIAFRLRQNQVPDFGEYVERLIQGIEEMLP
jgi:nanoRNase/pAp phosphatase (c-di-AMP/oligoRNAs hydrolase)